MKDWWTGENDQIPAQASPKIVIECYFGKNRNTLTLNMASRASLPLVGKCRKWKWKWTMQVSLALSGCGSKSYVESLSVRDGKRAAWIGIR